MARRARIGTLPRRVGVLDTRAARPAAKVAAPDYRGAQYAAWRAAVIARADGRCQHPGCDIAAPRMYADHIRELRDGGAPYDVANGQCLCARHHTLKTNAERARRHAAPVADSPDDPPDALPPL